MNASIPSTMQAVQLNQPGGKLIVRTVPMPQPQAGQVLIRMAAAPINPSDLGALMGYNYSGQRTYPITPGLEGSGRVVAAGSGLMGHLLMGRRVACAAALDGNGTWAEYMLTTAMSCIPLNQSVSLEQGAMALTNPLTALAIFEIAQRGNHRAMVNTAAASALGGMLIRMGKRRNLPIIHVVRRPEQADLLRSREAEYILDSSQADFPEQLRKIAESLHATLILDAIGGAMTKALAEAAPFGSTILMYSRLSQEDSLVDARTALVKHLHFEGWFLPNWIREKNLLQILQISQQVQALLGSDLQSTIARRLPLPAAQAGLEAYTDNLGAGKILLVADPQAVRLDG